MKIGYVCVNTNEQSLEKQIEQLKCEGCERILEETITVTKLERKELGKLLDHLRPKDIVIGSELTRLRRSTKDLFKNS